MESDSERLARIAVTVPTEGVHRLLADRFRGTPVGAALARPPLAGADLTYVVDAVAREIERDPAFADTLRHNVYIGGDAYQDIQAGRDVRIKGRYHIGKVEFGTGGLVSGVALLVLALGGGTAAVLSNAGGAVALSVAVGRWEQGGSVPMEGFETNPTVLVVTEDGEFTFSTGLTMHPPTGFPSGMGVPRGIVVECKGTVTPDGGQFTLRTTTGTCGTFSVKPTSDGTIMDVFVENGSVDGSIALRKIR